MSLLEFSDNNFKKDVLESELPVLVDFWASWCGPCKAITPLIEDLAKEYKDKIKIGKLNVGASPKTATSYGIMSVPTLIIFKNGNIMEQIVGVVSRSDLKIKIEENL